MTRKEWEAVGKAGKILGLGERATQSEMKRAYYKLSKQYHPDTAGEGHAADEDMMCRLTEAYNLLMRYCEEYRFSLVPDESDIYDAEDWWMDRFGQTPPW